MFLCNKKIITFLLVHVILFLSWLLTVTADIRFTFSFTIYFILHHDPPGTYAKSGGRSDWYIPIHYHKN